MEKQNETNLTPRVAARLPGSIVTELRCRARAELKGPCFGGKSTWSKLVVRLTFMLLLNLNVRLRFPLRKPSVILKG